MVEEEEVLEKHKARNGKIEVIGKVPIATREDLSTYYTPGVAFVSNAIKQDRSASYDYTNRGNMLAIVSDGTRVLGLGNIGPEAAMPVMEGKATLFKKFGGVDAVPLCIGTTDEDEIVKFIANIAPSFGAINIEDIESPKSLSIVERLSAKLDIPVFHDDQQGTAVAALGALLSALKLSGKDKKAKILINGAGSAGFGIARLLNFSGFTDISVFDSKGLIYKGRVEGMNRYKMEIAEKTNREGKSGMLNELVDGADVLIGASKAGAFTKEMIGRMNEKPIVFALANPMPEISYNDAKDAGAYIVATGRSDTPNQVNNLLAFPGICRSLLDVRARGLNYEMLEGAAVAISKGMGRRITPDSIMPNVLDRGEAAYVASNIAVAVAEVAIRTGMARVQKGGGEIKRNIRFLIKRYASIERKIIRSPA